MPLSAGTRVGPYEITGPLGAGGMGEVYRARDTALNRDVAIKVLPDLFLTDADRLARFTREAQTLAALNHPNIAQIYGVQEHGSTRAIVMELVPGEGLDARIARGRIPLREALVLARQIADALAAAHDAGIVHRDLKPANIRLRPDGTAKVLYFGLAKIVDLAAATSGTAHDAHTMSATQIGIILGTAGYMSPEQARGTPVDKRADVWAFGCVLYEMLTGKRAFSGATVTDTIGKILERDPDWSALPADIPPTVIRLLHRCLVKDARHRLRDLGDAAIDLDDAMSRRETEAAPASRVNRAAVAGAVLLLAAIAGGVAALTLWRREAPAPPAWAAQPMRFEIDPVDALQFGISADGRTIAWRSRGADGVPRIRVRSIDSPESRELPGTERGNFPFLRPDGQAIGFYAGGQLKRIDIASGTVRVLAETPGVSLGGTWSANDVIVFSNRFGLQAIPAGGGEPREVASLDLTRQENSLRWPQFLPDGRHFLYVARSGRAEQSAAYLGALDAKPRRLFATLSKVMFAPPGYVLFLRGQTLVAQRFDVESGRVDGDETPVATGVAAGPLGNNAGFAVSENGVLVHGPAGPPETSSLRWFDRAGKDAGSLAEPDGYAQFRIAPNGRRIVAAISDERTASRSIWILEAGQTPARLTQPGTNDWFPVWSRDGARVAFSSYRDGPLNIYVTSTLEGGRDAPVVTSPQQKEPNDWSPDGKFLLYRDTQHNLRGDLAVVEMPAATVRTELPRTDYEERTGRFSPDGRWIAYVSEETGRPEIWVQPFPATGAKWQVSVGGGDEPTWGPDGREIFYIAAPDTLVAVPVLDKRTSFVTGPARPLFKAGIALAAGGTQRYDAASDGTRFLVAVPSETSPPHRAVVVLNWPAILKR